MSEGVEWAVHICALLAATPRPLPATRLAEFHDLPPAYLAKHLQALSRAGLVESARGPGGGYRLARAATEISLLDITQAVDGDDHAFQCQEIRQRGPCPTPREACRTPCPIAATFWKAEAAWRATLQNVSLADIVVDAAKTYDPKRFSAFAKWLDG